MFSRSKGGYRGVAEPDTKLVSRFKAGELQFCMSKV